MLDWLKGILGEGYTEEIDKAVSEQIGKGFVARADFNAANDDLKAQRELVTERDKQLEALKKSTGDAEALKKEIETLQTTNKEQARKHAEEALRVRRDAAVDMALMRAEAINLKSVRAQLGMEKLELADDGTVKGLDDVLKGLKTGEDTQHLFRQAEKPKEEAAEKPRIKGFPPVEKGDVQDTDPFLSGFDDL